MMQNNVLNRLQSPLVRPAPGFLQAGPPATLQGVPATPAPGGPGMTPPIMQQPPAMQPPQMSGGPVMRPPGFDPSGQPVPMQPPAYGGVPASPAPGFNGGMQPPNYQNALLARLQQYRPGMVSAQ